MMAARATGAFTSLVLHAMLVLTVVVTGMPASGGAGVPAAPVKQGGDVDMRLIADQRGDGDGPACQASYRGIGIVVGLSGAVSEVVAGGPAAQAGLLVGGHLLNETIFVRDGYSLGRELPLRIERDGQRMDLAVHVGKVCYETVSHSIPRLRETP